MPRGVQSSELVVNEAVSWRAPFSELANLSSGQTTSRSWSLSIVSSKPICMNIKEEAPKW